MSWCNCSKKISKGTISFIKKTLSKKAARSNSVGKLAILCDIPAQHRQVTGHKFGSDGRITFGVSQLKVCNSNIT